MSINFPESDDRLDALWRMYHDNIAQSRQHETERSAIAGVVFTISAALVGLVTFDGAIGGFNDAIAAIFMISIGVFGAAFSFKNYERSSFHFRRARKFRNRIDRDYLQGEMQELNNAADCEHHSIFNWFQNAKLHRWWIAMNLTVVAIALLIVILAVGLPQTGSSN